MVPSRDRIMNVLTPRYPLPNPRNLWIWSVTWQKATKVASGIKFAEQLTLTWDYSRLRGWAQCYHLNEEEQCRWGSQIHVRRIQSALLTLEKGALESGLEVRHWKLKMTRKWILPWNFQARTQPCQRLVLAWWNLCRLVLHNSKIRNVSGFKPLHLW